MSWILDHWWQLLLGVVALAAGGAVLYRLIAYKPCQDCGRKTRYGDENGPLCLGCEDRRELEQLQERMRREPRVRCPKDRSTMTKELTDNRLIIDVCPTCGGVFLDSGELQRMLDAARAEGYDEGESAGRSSGQASGLAAGLVIGINS